MQHPFAALAPEYSALLARMRITRSGEVGSVAERLIGYVKAGRYGDVAAQLGMPVVFESTSFEREAGSNFSRSPAQGDRWDRVSVNVPRGLGPYPDWKSSALAAYRLDGLDKVGAGNWTPERFCYEGEIFNGMGYRAHGVHSPYLWAGTNIYGGGKFTSDGHFDQSAIDEQLGIVPLMVTIVALDPSLALVGSLPPSETPSIIPAPQSAPIGLGGGNRGPVWLQGALNTLDHAGLIVDGSYGRRTRAAVIAFQAAHGLEPDGLAGPLTEAAIEKELEA